MRKTRIAFIAHNCRAGGSLVIMLNMLKVLRAVLQEGEEMLVIYPKGYGYEEISLPESTEAYCYGGRHNPAERTWFEGVTLPGIIRKYNPDVIYGAGNIGLLHPESPQAILIHTPYPFYDKRHYAGIPPWERLRNRCLGVQIRKCLRQTRLVLAQTPIMKQRIAERMGYPMEQIRLIRFPPPAELAGAPREMKPTGEQRGKAYQVLILTRYLSHRNPAFLIPFCRTWKKELQERKIQFVTTVNKEDHSQAGRFIHDIQAHDLTEVIHNPGGLTREEVKAAFLQSNVLLFPSMMETLGMPYLEAMMMGVPILTTDLDFSHYICGEAAVYYDPWDLATLRERLFWLQDHPEAVKQMIQKGHEELTNPEKFARDWETSAHELFGHLRSIAVK